MPVLPERIFLICALKVLMKSCRFWSWETGPGRQVEHERICIESMNSVEMQCITEGQHIDNASLSTKIQSQKDKTNDFFIKTPHTSGHRNSLKHLMCTF